MRFLVAWLLGVTTGVAGFVAFSYRWLNTKW